MSRNKIILRTITTLLVAAVVLLAFSVSIIRLFGFEVYGVLTGSMEPKYPVGSLIYVKEINTDKLEVGDAISFKLSENVIATHRIIEIVPDENNPSLKAYRTKGDANDVVDSSLVAEADIIGKVVFCLPKMGYVLEYIQSPSGITTTIFVSIALILLVFISELITSDSEMLWRIRCAITGEDPRKAKQKRGRQNPQQRRRPDPYGEQRRPQQRPQRYEEDYRPQRRSARYEEDYTPSRSRRYEEETPVRRSARYEEPYSSSGSRRSTASDRYHDYGQSRRSDRGTSAARYDDYGSSRSSRSAASSARYDDYGAPRSSRSADKRAYSDSAYRSSRSSAGRYDDYADTARSTRSAGSGRYDDYGSSRASSGSRYSGSSYRSSRSEQDTYESRRRRSGNSDY